MQRKALTFVFELEVCERRVANDGIDLADTAFLETLVTDVLARMQRLRNASGDTIEFHTDELVWRGRERQKPGVSTARLQDGIVRLHAQAFDGLVHRRDDHGRGVESIERRPL